MSATAVEHLLPCRACAGRRALLHFAAAGSAIAALGILLEYSGLDIAVSTWFFDASTGTWPHRHGLLSESILYRGERMFVMTLYAAVLAALLVSLLTRSGRRWRRALLFVALATVTGPLIVGLLKSMVHVYVPWRLALFGGDLPYVRLFDPAPAGLSAGHAFPGGHSSGAFGWLSLYFLLRAGNHPRQNIVLGAVLAAGIVFAATQTVRGAHFPSHDVFTLAICWASGACWARLFFPASFARDE